MLKVAYTLSKDRVNLIKKQVIFIFIKFQISISLVRVLMSIKKIFKLGVPN